MAVPDQRIGPDHDYQREWQRISVKHPISR